MRLLDTDPGIVLSVSQDEFLLIHNAIGESLEAVKDWEFSTRLGVEADVARKLQSEMSPMFSQVFGPE